MPAPARPVDRSDLVKGFAVAKDKYVLLDKDELDAVRLESTRIIDIGEFVDATTIDRIYWDEPYYLAPDGKTGIEAYRRDPRRHGEAGQGGAGPRGDAHARAHLCAGAARHRHPADHAARHDEIRSSDEVFDRNLPKPDSRMLQIAEKIIEQQEAEFDPTEFKDRYEDALRDLIERKSQGRGCW